MHSDLRQRMIDEMLDEIARNYGAAIPEEWAVGMADAAMRVLPLYSAPRSKEGNTVSDPIDNDTFLRNMIASAHPLVGEPNEERLAEAVHEAYLATCARLGWSVKAENAVPYSQLPEDAKELDRATVRAVVAALRAAEGLESM